MSHVLYVLGFQKPHVKWDFFPQTVEHQVGDRDPCWGGVVPVLQLKSLMEICPDDYEGWRWGSKPNEEKKVERSVFGKGVRKGKFWPESWLGSMSCWERGQRGQCRQKNSTKYLKKKKCHAVCRWWAEMTWKGMNRPF